MMLGVRSLVANDEEREALRECARFAKGVRGSECVLLLVGRVLRGVSE